MFSIQVQITLLNIHTPYVMERMPMFDHADAMLMVWPGSVGSDLSGCQLGLVVQMGKLLLGP